MAIYEMLGLYQDIETAADAIDRLHKINVSDKNIEVLSGIPYKSEMLGRPDQKHWVGRGAMVGAVIGILTAFALTVGLYFLYTIDVGNQPRIFPIPPTLIVLFELTMLLTVLVTFLSFWLVNRFPTFRPKTYDPHITQGYIGVRAVLSKTQVDEAVEIYKQTGAQFTRQVEILTPQRDMGFFRFWAIFVVVVGVLGTLSLLFFYDVIKIQFPSQMIEQESVAYEQGPRLAAPAASVPIQGPVLVSGQPASQPIPSSPASIERGKVLFNIDCYICHGTTGVGNGNLAGFFNPPPFDLTSAQVQNLPDTEIFLVITQGRGQMPSLAENLSVSERWDVINYVRTLKK
jgi:mono/diheme cytochrome c family protein